MDTDKLVSRATAATVGLVAIFAAIISFYHIIHIGNTHGEYGAESPLTALSIDGTILAASLVLLYCSWKRLRVPWLARVMLWLGVGATLACNVGYGWTYGPVGALFSSWPAVAFVGTIEVVLQLGKIKRQAPKDLVGEQLKADYLAHVHDPITVSDPIDLDTGRSIIEPKPPVEIIPPLPDIESWNLIPNVARADAGLEPLPADPIPKTAAKPREKRNVPSKQSVKASAYNSLTGKLPSIVSIRNEYHVGQPRATAMQRLVRDTGCDFDKAYQITEEAKNA